MLGFSDQIHSFISTGSINRLNMKRTQTPHASAQRDEERTGEVVKCAVSVKAWVLLWIGFH